jgi:RNase P subunit RPR2
MLKNLLISSSLIRSCRDGMSEEEQKQKKKKKKKQLTVLETEKIESELLPQLVEALEELEKEKKYVDIQVCPKCKSPLVRRVGSMVGDMSAHMGFTPPKYECRECGWRERTVLKATNKPTTVREVVIMAEAKDADIEKKRKENR